MTTTRFSAPQLSLTTDDIAIAPIDVLEERATSIEYDQVKWTADDLAEHGAICAELFRRETARHQANALTACAEVVWVSGRVRHQPGCIRPFTECGCPNVREVFHA